jgi:hypothetical protein
MGRLRRLRWVWAVSLIFGALVWLLVGLYHAAVGRPTTPMTVARAERLFGQALRPGQHRDEVEVWLTAHGIPLASRYPDRQICYEILHRRGDERYEGWWMDVLGHQTVAECAGLDVNSVYSVVRVLYPDAGRYPLDQAKITVYLFFDNNECLLRHSVNESHLMP